MQAGDIVILKESPFKRGPFENLYIGDTAEVVKQETDSTFEVELCHYFIIDNEYTDLTLKVYMHEDNLIPVGLNTREEGE